MIGGRRIDWAAVQAIAAVVAAFVSVSSAWVAYTYSDAVRFDRIEQHAGQLSYHAEENRRRIDSLESRIFAPHTNGRRGNGN